MRNVHTAHPRTATRARTDTHRKARAARCRRLALGDIVLGMVTVESRSAGISSAGVTLEASAARGGAGASSSDAERRSRRMVLASAVLRSRSRAVAFSTTLSRPAPTPGFEVDGGGTRSRRCLYAMASDVSPVKG